LKRTRVTLLRLEGRAAFYMQYRDPSTGKKIRKSTNTSIRIDAIDEARKWERLVNEDLPPGLWNRDGVYYARFRHAGRLVRRKLSSDLELSKAALKDMRLRADREALGVTEEFGVFEILELLAKHDRGIERINGRLELVRLSDREELLRKNREVVNLVGSLFKRTPVEVHIAKFADRRHWVMYYGPTGKRIWKSTKSLSREGAEVAAMDWQHVINNGLSEKELHERLVRRQKEERMAAKIKKPHLRRAQKAMKNAYKLESLKQSLERIADENGVNCPGV
jgi:hypothetical protein